MNYHWNFLLEGSGCHFTEQVGDKIAPRLVFFVLEKELLNLSEMAPWCGGFVF